MKTRHGKLHAHWTAADSVSSGRRIVLYGREADLNLGSDSNTTVTAVGYGDTVEINDGTDNTIVLAGSRDVATTGTMSERNTIIVTGRSDSVSLGGDGTVEYYGGNGFVDVVPTYRADNQLPENVVTINAHGSGHLSVTGAGFMLQFEGGEGHYTVDGGMAANATIDGGEGGGLFIGGDVSVGYAPHAFHNGNNVITAGADRSTLVGSQYGTSVLNAAGFKSDMLIAGEYGQTTLNGGASSSNNLFQGYLGSFTPSTDYDSPSPISVFVAGGGNDTLIAGAGASTMTGGGGHDLFAFLYSTANEVPGGNSAVITDFIQGTDKIGLHGFSETPQQILDNATTVDGATVLHLNGGTTVTVQHTQLVLGDLKGF